MASRVAALFLLVVVCTGFAAAEIAVDCCLSTTVKLFPLIRIESYIIQEAGNGCEISATAFHTKGGRIVCVVHPEDPRTEAKWVKSHINYLNSKKAAQ
ncbi:C-C motif chemokine 8 [Lates calcarifer]|uniref:C-C motif chemokine 8 n=1 Tax=Lates calcarifer TaxID=8187 RepID=A0A4W6EHR1_LATCA|nr:C-C motif chemokine 8 [Lates calcarifer]